MRISVLSNAVLLYGRDLANGLISQARTATCRGMAKDQDRLNVFGRIRKDVEEHH
jgi:hypothetical protein